MSEKTIWTKERILSEFKRSAIKNGGIALGANAFDKVVPQRAWRPKYWARFSDLTQDAGYTPRSKMLPLSDDALLGQFAVLVRRNGRLPTHDEQTKERWENPTFPSPTTIRKHFGDARSVAAKLLEYCAARRDCEDILEICEGVLGLSVTSKLEQPTIQTGVVYLLKVGKYYKVGRSNDPDRREKEIGRLLPRMPRTVHRIETDDPAGIEAYWKRRFSAKFVRGTTECFELDAADVAAFKRMKCI